MGGAILFEKQQEDKTVTKQEFEALVARGPVLLDGAMGSNLLERGMPKGALSELWADRHPETVLELQTGLCRRREPDFICAHLSGPTGGSGPGRVDRRRGGPQRPAGGSDPPGCRSGYPGGGGSGHHGPDAWSPGTRRISTG